MQSILYDFLEWLTYPPRLSLCLAATGALLVVLARRKLGVACIALALGWSLLWSLPYVSDWLNATLARRHEMVPVESLPTADAIVVLGGSTHYGWVKREEVDADDLRHSRVAAGARAWLAGRAPLVVLSGGGPRNGPSEADTMARAIKRLGVPDSALVLEERSHSTRENARFTAALAQRLGIRCVLLTTSSVHMPRASLLFSAAGLQVIEMPVPVPRSGKGWLDRWLPSRSALLRSRRALKEYGGLVEARLRLGFDGPGATRLGEARASIPSEALCKVVDGFTPPSHARE